MDEPRDFTCPHCGTALDAVPGAVPQDVVCPHCGGLTVIPAADGSLEVADDAQTPSDTPSDTPAEAAPAADDPREDELSALRIRQLSAARRAAYRSRSYCVIGAVACVVAVVQLAVNAVRLIRAGGYGARPAAYLLVALLAACGAVYFFRKAMELDREARRSALPGPPAPGSEPDFSTLGDGSEQWKNLEDVR